MNKQKYHPDSGFSLLEVLVSILVVTFFTAAAMQMIVISAAFKAKAKEFTTANNLIEEDLETVRDIAADYEFPRVSTAAAVGATTVQLSSANGLKTNDRIQFRNSPHEYIITAPNPIPTTNPTITISPGIIATAGAGIAANTIVGSNTVCSASSTNTGLANYLRDKTQDSAYIDSSTTLSVTEGTETVSYAAVVGANPYTIPDTNSRIWLMRSDINLNDPPYNVMQVRYLVVKDDNNSPDSNRVIAKLTSEVIPNASFECIQ